jgi:hypothetical protein
MYRTVGKFVAKGLIAGALLVGSMGGGCDNNAFLEAGASGIGEGLVQIFEGIIEGTIAGMFTPSDFDGGLDPNL